MQAVVTNVVVSHLASGDAFFSGSALLVLAVFVATAFRGGWLRWARNFCLMLGAILVTLSVTPLPRWAYVLLTLVTLAWLLMQASQRVSSKWRHVTAACTVFGWLAAVAWEVPYHLRPELPVVASPALGVIGDSVTAGMQIGENEPETWPRILARARHIRVNDQSQPGAKCASALKQAALLTPADTIVVMEIGGNDLLGTTSTADFERDLQTLLSEICRPGRTVVLFELPLLPFCQGYGRAQRQLCREHGVYLIPKHVLLGVLRAGGATIDSIHLTAAGQERLADETWRVIGPEFETLPKQQPGN